MESKWHNTKLLGNLVHFVVTDNKLFIYFADDECGYDDKQATKEDIDEFIIELRELQGRLDGCLGTGG